MIQSVTGMKTGKSFQAEGTACAKASRQKKPYVHRMLVQVVEGEREKTGNSQRPKARSWGPFSDWVKGAAGPAFCGSEEDDQRSGSMEPAGGDPESSALLQGLGTSPAGSGSSRAEELTEAAS